jgi:endonuclease YncB( thermonuclease family)
MISQMMEGRIAVDVRVFQLLWPFQIMTLHPQNQQYHQIILVYQGQADCFRGIVTEIVDGDTLDINNVRVRLALVNTPGRVENGYTEANRFCTVQFVAWEQRRW